MPSRLLPTLLLLGFPLTLLHGPTLAGAVKLRPVEQAFRLTDDGSAEALPRGTQSRPAAAQPPKVKIPPASEADLPNGLHLIVLEDHRVPTVSFQVLMIGAGGYHDPADHPGLARFAALMIREGTTTRGARQIAEQLGRMRATLNVSTGMANQAATLSASSLSQDFPQMLELAADILLNPSFPEEELARFKQRTRAELIQQRSGSDAVANETFARVIYGGHPAARVAPTIDSLERTRREALVAFHREHYVPDHASIGIAGDITMAEARKQVETRLGSWKKAGVPRPTAVDPASSATARIHLIDRPDAAQTTLVVGAQVMNRTSPDYLALSVLNNLVGAGGTGRLFLRLQGYTSNASGSITALNYRGIWRASASVGTEVTEAALRELLNEIARLRDQRVPDEEFLAVKRSMVAAFAASLASPAAALGNYITRWAYNLPTDYWDRYPERIMSLTPEQLQAAARQYLDASRLQIVAVGDAKRIADGLKKFGPLEMRGTL